MNINKTMQQNINKITGVYMIWKKIITLINECII